MNEEKKMKKKKNQSKEEREGRERKKQIKIIQSIKTDIGENKLIRERELIACDKSTNQFIKQNDLIC